MRRSYRRSQGHQEPKPEETQPRARRRGRPDEAGEDGATQHEAATLPQQDLMELAPLPETFPLPSPPLSVARAATSLAAGGVEENTSASPPHTMLTELKEEESGQEEMSFADIHPVTLKRSDLCALNVLTNWAEFVPGYFVRIPLSRDGEVHNYRVGRIVSTLLCLPHGFVFLTFRRSSQSECSSHRHQSRSWPHCRV